MLFYKNVFGSHFDDVPAEVMVLQELVPKYYGTHDIVDRAGEVRILAFVVVLLFIFVCCFDAVTAESLTSEHITHPRGGGVVC